MNNEEETSSSRFVHQEQHLTPRPLCKGCRQASRRWPSGTLEPSERQGSPFARNGLRLEKAFGASQEELLRLQAKFDQHDMRARAPDIAVGAYVPSFLTIRARDIEQWAERHLEARSLLAVLLRKLVHSTGEKLSHVDFPGYDNAERKGWDGQLEADAATPWIPHGKSGWEFGCNEDPREKAEGDYTNRVAAISAKERAETISSS